MKRRQTLSGYIRMNLPRIEQEMKAGFSQKSILDGLKAEGFDTTLHCLRQLLYRARQRATSGEESPGASRPLGETSPPSFPVAPPAPRPAPNPLTKSKGFDYTGTKDLDPDKMF